MKLIVLWGIIGIVLLTGCLQEGSSLDEYYASIDYSCNVDSDCEIKDIHNCCGYYPVCTSRNAVVSPELVNQICTRDGLASVCGWPSVNGCECVENKCSGTFDPALEEQASASGAAGEGEAGYAPPAVSAGQQHEPEPGTAVVCFADNCITAEVAESSEERSRGLMFREELGENEGMLFVFERQGIHPFWMKNTLIPLNMIWVDETLHIVHIESAVPCTTENCVLYMPKANAKYVVETNAGFAERNGLSLGGLISINYN